MQEINATLVHIFYTNENCDFITEDLCSDVSNAGALNVVMHTLKTFSDSTAVLECALWALACLSKCS